MAAPIPASRSGAAAFLDLDKTIIAGSSALAFSGPMRRRGLISRRVLLRSAYSHFLLMFSGADEEYMTQLRDQLTRLCAGWDVEAVRAVVTETLHAIVEPLVYAEATELIAEHRGRGDDVVVLSASGAEVVEPIAGLVGADDWMATRMVIEDGRYSGQIEFYCYGQNKAVAAREFAAARGYDLGDCHAYSDSITDLPLLEAVGHPTAVNPDRALRRVATDRGWPILAFSNPVSVRSRLRPASVGTAAAVSLGAAALVGAGWFGVRRWRADQTS